VLLGHIDNHSGTPEEAEELAVATLHEHLRWSRSKAGRVLARVRTLGWVRVGEGDIITLTPRGADHLHAFRRRHSISGA
ncbi:MAG: hypothetical protein EA396_11000, partial [Anaerolineaceae bacterium]